MVQALRALFVLLCLAATAVAQQGGGGAKLRQGSQELGFWGGYSPDSSIGIGQVYDRAFFELNAQYAITLWGPKHVAVKWVSELLPVALLNEPTEYYFNKQHQLTHWRSGATTYGIGATPLGMQLNLLNGRRVQPYVDAHGGMVYFTRQEPVPSSSQFNFTFNFGAGAQVFIGNRSSMLIGYKYHHISNNQTAPQNPGIDNHEAYAGWLWRWKR